MEDRLCRPDQVGGDLVLVRCGSTEELLVQLVSGPSVQETPVRRVLLKLEEVGSDPIGTDDLHLLICFHYSHRRRRVRQRHREASHSSHTLSRHLLATLASRTGGSTNNVAAERLLSTNRSSRMAPNLPQSLLALILEDCAKGAPFGIGGGVQLPAALSVRRSFVGRVHSWAPWRSGSSRMLPVRSSWITATDALELLRQLSHVHQPTATDLHPR